MTGISELSTPAHNIIEIYSKIFQENEICFQNLRWFSDENIIELFLLDIGIENIGHRNIIAEEVRTYKEKKPICEGGENCSHLFFEYWSNRLYCSDCLSSYELTEENNLSRWQEEQFYIQKLGKDGTTSDDHGVERGVSIKFLKDFCNKYNLWEVPTREVRRKYILPMTSGLRCRYVELPFMQRSENVGKATTFVSHCWGAKFGDLVAALCEEADENRKVYVDIFSARQWPSSRADSSHVEAVIKQCASFLAICSTGSNQREVFKNIKAIDKVSRRMEAIPREIQLKISFFRVWCLYEIFVAITAEVPMILKGGYHEIISRRGHNRGVRMDRFLPDKGMLQALFWYVDVQLAEISSPADHSRIFRKIAEGGGEESVNRAVGGFILSHSNGCDNPVVQAAACSDELAIAKMLQDVSANYQY